MTTQGTALGLFLPAFDFCRPGDEAVITTPCFPPSRDAPIGTGITVRECRLAFDQAYSMTGWRVGCAAAGTGSSPASI